jgi:hypothetical protein
MKLRIATAVVACAFAGAVSAAGTSDSNVRSSANPAFESIDSNRDGFISKEEASRSSTSAKLLKSMDKNLDGKVSKSEYESGGGSSEGPESGSSGTGSGNSGSP